MTEILDLDPALLKGQIMSAFNEDDPRASYTRGQNIVLRDRTLNQLAAEEKLAFANLAGKPSTMRAVSIGDELDMERLNREIPERRLTIADMFEIRNRCRAHIATIDTQLADIADPAIRSHLLQSRDILVDRCREAHQMLQPFAKRSVMN